METITQAVGIRNGVTMMPNNQPDLRTVTGLLDRIPLTSSLPGTGPLRPRDISPRLTRKLVSVNGTSIKWFGVVVPLNGSGGIAGGAPHMFFTPAPWQGGYLDNTYDQFTQMTRITFDLDGQASRSHWRPSRGVIYRNTQAPPALIR